MTQRLGIVMDPMTTVNYAKDSTLAMMWEAQERGWEIVYFEQKDLFLKNAEPFGKGRDLKLFHEPNKFYEIGAEHIIPLAELDMIFMRKDPPFNAEYIYTTYILEHAEMLGVLVVNRPQSLRDANEKLFTTHFPQCCPPHVVTQSIEVLRGFWHEYHDIICKPLDTMGGLSVFRLQEQDVNANVVFETLTKAGTTHIIAQKYIPEITLGDKRIILINGEVIPHVLSRVPQGEDWRGNLAVGAKGVVQPLTERDQWICDQIGPTLRARGLYFVGIDVIGDYLTEINVTSPTGIRQIDKAAGINISSILFDALENLS